MHVYLSTSPTGDVFSAQWTKNWKESEDEGLPHFVWENITYGKWEDKRLVDLDVPLPLSVQHNGSLWADIFLVRDGASPDPSNSAFNPNAIHHVRKLLTRYLPRIKVRKEKSLLKGGREGEEAKEEDATPQDQPDVIVSHWHNNLTLALVSDSAVVPYAQIPPPIAEHIHVVPNLRDATGTKMFYRPIIFPNDFWQLRSQNFEINETTSRVPLQIELQPISYFKFQLFASLGAGFNEAAKQQGSASMAEFDEIKRMLVETNPYFLMLTAAVTVLHSVFEMLAFKSDVSHWRKRKELVGVSVRTIITNVFVQLVILLYLVDNNDNTSWMILMGQGVGMLIEAWKITKAVDVRFLRAPPGSILPYKVEFRDKHVLSEDEKKTQEYDKLAFRYVSYFTIPALAIYSVYSLIYETHRGWYSFVISTLTSFVYMFGFAQLVPQLIINYKLKSVAHMPMKAMAYKTLSTVIDDLFAFCIKMPILHRLACFRDDVVFLIFLYQRWIYRVDPKRVNEYGQVLVNDVDHAEGSADAKKDK
ncbi:cleft lip and palate transmembrane 1 [Fomitiporia mediterranea MF3/22]|uniref:cleft lip and palate transmembrane 1 n=1 Tax=Fomitiporia mediterranea (strain MF3/22) TaxID=694068 RepID=UPI0004407375|nr:cleft lip and palate transmembrane 1 [Fomitiporia mediterranea MF3/22]EJD01145.1 cleft lip and palate transmembrane 1 [Fomitiporia mediterranea MF3/22]